MLPFLICKSLPRTPVFPTTPRRPSLGEWVKNTNEIHEGPEHWGAGAMWGSFERVLLSSCVFHPTLPSQKGIKVRRKFQLCYHFEKVRKTILLDGKQGGVLTPEQRIKKSWNWLVLFLLFKFILFTSLTYSWQLQQSACARHACLTFA